EDGIRAATVTGVQTCALPILHDPPARLEGATRLALALAAVARPGRLPTVGLACVRAARSAHATRRAASRRRRAEGPLQLALPERSEERRVGNSGSWRRSRRSE